MLPGFLAILALSVLYAAFGGVPLVQALFFGLKPAVLAVVVADLASSPRQAYGLRGFAYGFAYLHREDDHCKLDLEAPLYDARYAWCQRLVRESTPAA